MDDSPYKIRKDFNRLILCKYFCMKGEWYMHKQSEIKLLLEMLGNPKIVLLMSKNLS